MTLRQNILARIKTILEGVSTIGFKHVEINRSTPVDLDVIAFPACFIYSGPEEMAADDDQVLWHETWKWEIALELWFRGGNVSEETALGAVHEAMFADYSFNNNAAFSSRIGSSFHVLDHDRDLRAMRITYSVVYRHRSGQPSTL